jgi:23S rRNA (guanosine2251-2'-O)-methyltransferase
MNKLSMDALGRIDAETFRNAEKTPFVIVYDNVRSALNVGSAFRTADSFRLAGVMLCGITAQPPHKEIFKTALGATETVDWQYFEHTTDAIANLRKAGYEIWSVEQVENSTMLHDFVIKTDKKYAFIFGNEVDGVSEEALAASDGCIEIPQIGSKHSLNISVCTGIIVWEAFRQIL